MGQSVGDGVEGKGATVESLRMKLVSKKEEGGDGQSLGLCCPHLSHWLKPYLKPIFKEFGLQWETKNWATEGNLINGRQFI